MGLENMHGGRKAFSTHSKVVAGGLSIPLGLLMLAHTWGAPKVKQIEVNTATIDQVKEENADVKAEVKEMKAELVAITRNMDRIAIEQRHVVDDLKVVNAETREHRKEMKDLMLKLIKTKGGDN